MKAKQTKKQMMEELKTEFAKLSETKKRVIVAYAKMLKDGYSETGKVTAR